MKTILSFFLLILLVNVGFSQDMPPVAVNDTFDIYSLDDTITLNLVKNDYSQDGHPFYIVSASGSISHTDSTATFAITYEYYFKISGIKLFAPYMIVDTMNGLQLGDYGQIYLNFHIPFRDTLDINNVAALINDNGNHFWDLTGDNLYNVPKGSTENAIFCFATWIGGLDANDELHVAADRYGSTGQDFFPGPVSNGNAYNSNYDNQWHKVWKINKSEIDYHESHWWLPGYQIPDVIKYWPGNGDVSQGQAAILAPFFDNNNNGQYEPLLGDYPLIKGDQAVFFVHNDVRRPHTETSGSSLGIEIHGMAYAFNCPEDSALMYTTFLHYDIYNRSTTTYHDTYLGTFVDSDLGYAWDDYVGCDLPRNSFYTYNGSANPPQTAASAISTTILGGPALDPDGLDNPKTDQFGNPLCDYSITGSNFQNGIADDEKYGMNSFIYFNNASSGPTSDPNGPADYFNLLRCIWKDGVHMKYGGNGHPNSGASDVDCHFMFPALTDFCDWGTNGDPVPGYQTGAGGSGIIWTEEAVGNVPDDRRGAISMGPFTFQPGAKQELDVAFVFGRDWTSTVPWDGVLNMQARIDQIRYYFEHDSTPCGGSFSGFARIDVPVKSLKIYPVPAKDQLNIEYDNSTGSAMYRILGVAGNIVADGMLAKGNHSLVSMNSLKPGIYLLMIRENNCLVTRKFIKD